MSVTEKIFGWCYPLLKKSGLPEIFSLYISLLINILILAVLAYLIFWVFRIILITIMAVIAKKTHTKFDNLLINSKTAKYLSHLIPLLFVYRSMPVILKDFVYWETIFGKMTGIYIVILTLWIVKTLLNALKTYLYSKQGFTDKPLDSYVQAVMLVLWILGVSYIILFLFDTSPKNLITTLGAISALIILIFRDTILSFVASIQVSISDMVRVGDWITMEKFGADGHVIEINLATIKVKNFDYTTTTIPTYSLLSDSFRNWRGMTAAGGRRIKRHILIRSNSIRFLKDHELENLKKIQIIANYIEHRKTEIDRFNLQHKHDKSLPINGRNLTNFGLFRKYIISYLEQYPGLNKDMVLTCRQLQATPQGIPLEIFAFSNDKRFENYEYIMADIFDHIFASVSYFDLELFEMPAGKSNTTNV